VNTRALVLDIITPDGVALSERDVDAVIVHRRERRFERGSEIAVFPLHGPMLVRIPVAPVRYRRAGATVHLAVGGGFMEVLRDRVRIVTRQMERVPAAAPDARAAAGDVCRRWRREAEDTHVQLVGYS
jgi:F-type H+-transporting ATPase subunit epsilon